MSGLFVALIGLTASSSLHCAVRREISPCFCRQEEFPTAPINSNPVVLPPPVSNAPIIPGGIGNDPGGTGATAAAIAAQAAAAAAAASSTTTLPFTIAHHGYGERIEVTCERMDSFEQVAQALRGKFTPEQQITLRVSRSNLRDISKHGLKELRMSIVRLELNHDHLGQVNGDVFTGLNRTQYLSLADNEVPAIPKHILSHLSLLRTLDLSRNHISRIELDDFKYNPALQHLAMAGNDISEMVPGSLPPLIKHLHVGRNRLHSLNRTLKDLDQLEWLLINSNELTSLDGELPLSGNNLKMLYAVDNKLTHLPVEFKQLHRLESLFLQHNKIRSLEGTLQKARRLKFLELSYNELQEITEDDFTEAEMLEDLELGHNALKTLGPISNGANSIKANNALYPLRSLKCLNLTHNLLREFSFASLRGLRELRLLDLSNNRIEVLYKGTPPPENLVEGEEIPGAKLQDLQLQHNNLRKLNESLFQGMKELRSLNLSHNALGPTIGPQDLGGLERLKVLDLSHNELVTLEDIAETSLPALEELNASHNRLITLSERDFRGFPVLCWADLSMNRIRSLVPELVAKTQCTVHGVQDVLRIYLQENPLLCDPALADLTVTLEVYHAKIYGVANDCPEPTTIPPPPTVQETTSMQPPSLPATLLLAVAASAADGNVSFAATLE